MKHSLYKFAPVIIFVALAGCADNAAQKDSVHFSFNINAENGAVADFSTDAALLVSLETRDGNSVYNLQEIAFKNCEQGFTTSPLDLNPGEYVVTEFMLVNRDKKILYTARPVDTPLGQGEKNPLGLNFRVSANGASDVKQAEMLDTRNFRPDDLGLASFSIQNSFQIAVSEEGSEEIIPATAVLLRNQDTVAYLNVPAFKSRIGFDGDPNDTYTLLVSNEGSEAYVQPVTMTEFAKKYNASPLKIPLKRAFVMIGNGDTDPEQPFYFSVGGTAGEITVNWGDGSVENYSLDSYGVDLTHSYGIPQDYRITVTGDLNNITFFYSFYGGSIFREISFKNLPNLVEIRYGLTGSPAVIDLSNNSKLQFAMLPHLENMETLILPKSHEITFIEIDGLNLLDTQDVDAVVDNIYANAVKKNLRDGIIEMRQYWAQEETDLTMVGPPSAAALTKLQTLHDSYGWMISPGQEAVRVAAEARTSGMMKKL